MSSIQPRTAVSLIETRLLSPRSFSHHSHLASLTRSLLPTAPDSPPTEFNPTQRSPLVSTHDSSLRTLPARPSNTALPCVYTSGTRSIDDAAKSHDPTSLASPARLDVRHLRSTSRPNIHNNLCQLNPRTGSLVRKKTLAACNIASPILSLPMRFL